MADSPLSQLPFGRKAWYSQHLLAILAVSLALTAEPGPRHGQKRLPEAIPAVEFSRIINQFSEDDGFFRSDNFISNETSYLHIVDKLQGMGNPGGAYIGVGPEQNFTYIAKVRPRIAFIVDIRRQAVIQHLMFKALFHLARDRTHFLGLLFSKPTAEPRAPGPGAAVERILDYLGDIPGDPALLVTNMTAISRVIEDDFLFPLQERDRASLDYILNAFREENLSIQYRFGGPGWPSNPWGRFPTLRDLILQRDLSGKLGNFLASREDYDFLRDMQERNRIIPIVGDFAGTRAFSSVAGYLRANGYTVSAFYTSNVEQYLFLNGVFKSYVENVRRLPITDKSLFIRSYPNMRESHPARVKGHRLTTLLQKVPVFLKDFDDGLYPDYWSLATTHYVSADAP